MTSSLIDQTVMPLAIDMLACLTDAVQLLEHPPANVMLRPGNQVELLVSTTRDECCEGLAWVRVAGVYPSAHDFPNPDLRADNCGPVLYAVQLELGVARCAPVEDERTIPSADQWNEVTGLILNDGAAMRRAICCWSDLHRDARYVVGVWQPLVTSGGCAGAVLPVTVMANACDCPDDED